MSSFFICFAVSGFDVQAKKKKKGTPKTATLYKCT